MSEASRTLEEANRIASVEPLQRCDRCRELCEPGFACVSADPGHINAARPCRPWADLVAALSTEETR